MSTIRATYWSPLSGSGSVYVVNNVSGATETSASLYVSGNAVLGKTATQTVQFNAVVSSSVLPHANCTYNLGSAGNRWGMFGCTGSFQSITNSGSADLVISSSADIAMYGNVGLGTAAPAAAFHISKADCRARIEATTANNNCQLDFYNANGKYANIGNSINTAGSLFEINEVSPSAGSRMTILTGGNVGIGTTSPGALLHVAGAGEFDGNLTVDGDLTVNGTTTTINSTTLVVDDKLIELAHSPSGTEGDDSAIDGGGIILKSSDSDKSILWTNSTDKWTFNQGIHVDVGNLIVDANVGVGVASPSSTAGIARFIEVSDASSAGIVMDDTGGTEFALYSASNYLRFTSEAANRMSLSDDGKLGIGVDTPARTLHVGGDAEVDGDLYCNDDVSLNSDGAILNFGADSDISLTHAADTSLTLGGASTTTGLIINNTATDGDPFLAFALSGTQTFTMGIDDGDSDKFKIGTTAIGTNTRLTIDSSGNVGIGTNSPSSLLELESSSGDLIFEMDNNASNAANFQIQNGAGNSRVDMVMNDGSANTTLTFKGQKIGINDTSPSFTLDVAGDAQITTNLTLGGILSLADGSASAPSLTNTGDTNCGLYFSAADTLAFTAGGTAQVTFADGVIAPVTDNDVDLGTSSLQWKKIWAEDVDVDGTLEADAITIAGATLSETIADTVGAMVGSNTETGIAVTYEDGDNTLDFVLAAAQTSITSIYNSALKIGYGASHARIDFANDNQIDFEIDGNDELILNASALYPYANGGLDLGTTSYRFANVYTQDLHLANDRGDWTIIEEEDYLSIRNNKNGKLFKIVMQEISEE